MQGNKQSWLTASHKLAVIKKFDFKLKFIQRQFVFGLPLFFCSHFKRGAFKGAFLSPRQRQRDYKPISAAYFHTFFLKLYFCHLERRQTRRLYML